MARVPRPRTAYLMAVSLAALSLALTFPTTGPLGGAYPYFPLIAVFLSALHGGLGPGLVAVALSTLGFDLLFLGPPLRLGVGSLEEAHRLVVFVLTGTAASWIAARFLASRREAEVARSAAEAAGAEARRVGAQQEQLVAIVSHDLRNPLAALEGNLRLLRRSGALEPRQGRAVAGMERSVARMSAMVRDLLDVARSRQGELVVLSREEVRVGEVCARVIAEVADARPGAAVLLEVDGDDLAWADPERLAQGVANLVANALAHGSGRAPVRLRVVGLPERVAVEVANEGDPIDPGLAPLLFEPFRRGRRDGPGLGLGLFIVREIARAHGGEATFRPGPGVNVFAIEVPRGAVAAVSAARG